MQMYMYPYVSNLNKIDTPIYRIKEKEACNLKVQVKTG